MGNEFSPCPDADSQQGPVPKVACTADPDCGLFVQALGFTSENKSPSCSGGEAAPLPAERTARFTTPGHRLRWQPKGRERQRKGCCCFGPALPISCHNSAQENPLRGSPQQESPAFHGSGTGISSPFHHPYSKRSIGGPHRCLFPLFSHKQDTQTTVRRGEYFSPTSTLDTGHPSPSCWVWGVFSPSHAPSCTGSISGGG